MFTFEGHDVFAPLTLAATVGGLGLMTNVALDSPQPNSTGTWATDDFSRPGRFVQDWDRRYAQIEKRYGGAFDRPVPRMIEDPGSAFDFCSLGDRRTAGFSQRKFYRRTLMTPTFNQG